MSKCFGMIFLKLNFSNFSKVNLKANFISKFMLFELSFDAYIIFLKPIKPVYYELSLLRNYAKLCESMLKKAFESFVDCRPQDGCGAPVAKF